MTAQIWMLEIGRTRWRLHAKREGQCELLASAEFAATELAAQSSEICRTITCSGYGGEAIVLALESCWCLAATIPIDRPQVLRDRQTMLFRLEEWIPWGAEDIVADFVSVGESAFSVAAPTEPLAEFLNGLAASGLNIQNILPKALLAAYEQIGRNDCHEWYALVLEDEGWIDVFTIIDRKVTSWCNMPSTVQAVCRHIDALAIERGTIITVVSYGVNTAITDELSRGGSARLESSPLQNEITIDDLALSASEKLIEGQFEIPLELKRGAFGRSRRNAALRRYTLVLQTACVILLLSAIAALLYRGKASADQASEIAARQSDVFRSVFPNAKVPTGVTARLRSELAKLKGLRGDDSSLSTSVSAIVVLKGLLNSVPTDRRIRFLEIRIEEGRLYLDGEVRIHSDAELITQRLRAEGFEASAPKTQRLDDQRVSLRITATLPATAQLAMGTSP